ncbi:UNVERIFIED_CONTAM: hypothetical protein PYX00_011433 [Menopon gallinae]|uniref:Uncharacterized protein n=1 Tax=Menopon gallinae TaxID=328185 RepID=A0AAW2H7F8_9NEOP
MFRGTAEQAVDWRAVGEMVALCTLDVSYSEMELGTVHRCFQKLGSQLMELHVHGELGLNDRDWKTVGRMRHLENLCIVGCNVKAEKSASSPRKVEALALTPMTHMRRALCHVLLATYVLSAQPGRIVAVRFTNHKRNTIGRKEYSQSHKMFKVSEYMRRAAEWAEQEGKDAVEIGCDPDIFDKVAGLLDSRPLSKVSAEEIVEIVHLLEYLGVDRDEEAACCAYMARKTMELYEDVGGSTESIRRRRSFSKKVVGAVRGTGRLLEGARDRGRITEKVMAEFGGMKLRSVRIYTLQLLREWAMRHGMCVVIRGEWATLCTPEYQRTHQSCGELGTASVFSRMRVVLGDGGNRLHPEVLFLLEMVADAMEISKISVRTTCLGTEYVGAIEDIRGTGRLGQLEVWCCGIEPGTIHGRLQELKSHVVDLDISGSCGLDEADWRTVGEMVALRRLCVYDCSMEPGTVHRCFRELRWCLVELDVSGNTTLGRMDWQTIGEMRSLRRLDASFCVMEAGVVAEHFQGLKARLTELSVHWNFWLSGADWGTIGEMAALEKLNVSACGIKPGTMSRHFQELKGHLMDLNVSFNPDLDGKDWKTIGEMMALRMLDMSFCNTAPEIVSEHLQGLENCVIHR